jgi:hypothetical protein
MKEQVVKLGEGKEKNPSDGTGVCHCRKVQIPPRPQKCHVDFQSQRGKFITLSTLLERFFCPRNARVESNR